MHDVFKPTTVPSPVKEPDGEPVQAVAQSSRSSRQNPERVVEVRGWVATKNSVGGLVFAIVRDGTGYIQVSAKKGLAPPESMDAIGAATKESAVAVKGVVREDAEGARRQGGLGQGFQDSCRSPRLGPSRRPLPRRLPISTTCAT